VDETSAAIVAAENRPYSAVKKGFTPFRDNDVLFAKITPCMENGKIALARDLANGLGFGSTEFHVLRASSRVLPEWLRYFVLRPTYRAQAKRRMTGAVGQQRVPAEFLAASLVPLPHVPEQRRIVDLLSRAENIVRMQREAEARAKDIIPALFLDMFGDPARNERGWPLASLGSLLLDGPKNGLYKHASLYGEGTPILRIDSFYDGSVDDIADLRRVRISEDEKQAFALQPGDIVINRVNSPEYLGKSAIVPRVPEPTVFESNMMRLRLNTEMVLPEYMIQLLQLSSMRRALVVNAKHAINQSSINQTDVKGLQPVVPPVALQETFVAQVRALLGLAMRQRDGSALAESAFQSLLAGVFQE
jgi:type I restriction enzyme, S subunit